MSFGCAGEPRLKPWAEKGRFRRKSFWKLAHGGDTSIVVCTMGEVQPSSSGKEKER